MSIRVMTRVWDNSESNGSKLLVLLALADRADDDGVCWPGVASLAKKARVSERQVQLHLRSLEEKGEIFTQRHAGRTKTNHYFITTGLNQDELKDVLMNHPKMKYSHNDAHAISYGIIISNTKGEEDYTISQDEEKVKSSAEKGEIQRTEKVKPISPDTSVIHHDTSYTPSDDEGSDCAEHETASTHGQCFVALAKVCAYEIDILTNQQRGMLNKESKMLRKRAAATADQIRDFSDYWFEHDWRGKQGSRPKPHQVREEWGRYLNWSRGGKHTNTHGDRIERRDGKTIIKLGM